MWGINKLNCTLIWNILKIGPWDLPFFKGSLNRSRTFILFIKITETDKTIHIKFYASCFLHSFSFKICRSIVAYHFQFPRILESNPPSPQTILSNQMNLHRQNNKYCKYFLFNKILFLAKYYKFCQQNVTVLRFWSFFCDIIKINFSPQKFYFRKHLSHKNWMLACPCWHVMNLK